MPDASSPMKDFDVNKVAADFLASRMDDIANLGKEFSKQAFNTFRLQLSKTYTTYLESIGRRCGYTRSFFIRDEPTYLYKFYVPISLRQGTRVIKSATWQKAKSKSNRIIVTGSGGSGKSMLLKHFLLNALLEKDKTPVLVELRDVDINDQNLVHVAANIARELGLNIELQYFQKLMEKGQIVLFFDGVDEIESELRKDFIKHINQISKKFPKVDIAIASRPDHQLSELSQFTILTAEPFTIDQCTDLVERLPAEPETKRKFLEDLSGGLYQKHKSFLSNPLLLSIMVLTYGYSADIPNKLSIFYNQAYEALFQRHDALKGAFKRKKETTLDILDFARVFSAFCLLTYDNRIFQISHSDAIDYLEKARGIVNIDFTAQDFLTDLLQSVCLLVEDGLFYSFSHRSFQEYFTARFICQADPELKRKLLERFVPHIGDDAVYSMAYELDPSYFETHVILPFLNDLFKQIGLKKVVGIAVFLKFTKRMWGRFLFYQGELKATSGKSKINAMVWFILTAYRSPSELRANWSKNYGPIISQYIEMSKSVPKERRGTAETTVVVSELKTTDPFLKELYSSGIFFSKNVLETLIELRNEIEERGQRSRARLDELFFN